MQISAALPELYEMD